MDTLVHHMVNHHTLLLLLDTVLQLQVTLLQHRLTLLHHKPTVLQNQPTLLQRHPTGPRHHHTMLRHTMSTVPNHMMLHHMDIRVATAGNIIRLTSGDWGRENEEVGILLLNEVLVNMLLTWNKYVVFNYYISVTIMLYVYYCAIKQYK